jgi:hypothetical protein
MKELPFKLWRTFRVFVVPVGCVHQIVDARDSHLAVRQRFVEHDFWRELVHLAVPHQGYIQKVQPHRAEVPSADAAQNQLKLRRESVWSLEASRHLPYDVD